MILVPKLEACSAGAIRKTRPVFGECCCLKTSFRFLFRNVNRCGFCEVTLDFANQVVQRCV